MTCPIVEIFCPECKERMTLINNPKLEHSSVEGYGEIVDYHYRCDSNERHVGKWHDWSDLAKPIIYKGKMVNGEPINVNENFSKCGKDGWCGISTEKEIIVMRILIPKLDSDNYDSVATTATVNMINIEEQMREDGIKFHKSKAPNTNLLLNIPTRLELSIEEKVKDLEPKIIQWLTLEAEVMNEVNKRVREKTFTSDGWYDYFLELVEKHGTINMVNIVIGMRKVQKQFEEYIELDDIINKMDETPIDTITAATAEDWSYKEGLLEDLNGLLHEPVILNGVYICPMCKGVDGRMTVMIALNSKKDDPDYLHYRCPKCKMDFKMRNKAIK